MLIHIVLFKMKDRSAQSIEKAKEVLLNMDGKIEYLRHLEVGTDVLHSERSYDLALYTKFDNMDDMQKYQVHPEHKKVQQYMVENREASVTVDYEL